jgi:hypothetical protein
VRWDGLTGESNKDERERNEDCRGMIKGKKYKRREKV